MALTSTLHTVHKRDRFAEEIKYSTTLRQTFVGGLRLAAHQDHPRRPLCQSIVILIYARSAGRRGRFSMARINITRFI